MEIEPKIAELEELFSDGLSRSEMLDVSGLTNDRFKVWRKRGWLPASIHPEGQRDTEGDRKRTGRPESRYGLQSAKLLTMVRVLADAGIQLEDAAPLARRLCFLLSSPAAIGGSPIAALVGGGLLGRLTPTEAQAALRDGLSPSDLQRRHDAAEAGLSPDEKIEPLTDEEYLETLPPEKRESAKAVLDESREQVRENQEFLAAMGASTDEESIFGLVAIVARLGGDDGGSYVDPKFDSKRYLLTEISPSMTEQGLRTRMREHGYRHVILVDYLAAGVDFFARLAALLESRQRS